jgi:regulator of RNase E activity RraB
MSRLPLLALVLSAALAAGCVPQDDGAVIGGPGENNAAVIDGLREAGTDMDAPHLLEFYSYFPSREAADRAAKALVSKGYKTEVDGPDEDKEFELYASRESKLDVAAIDAFERELDKVATAEKGYYDGWEAAVVD